MTTKDTNVPTTQKALRGTRALRAKLRVVNTPEHHAWLAGHLTPRDRWLIRMLYEHKVFTTHHIADLAFPSLRAANHRLLNLTRWGVLHRFQPHRDLGSHPMHYVLDQAGATVLAHEEGIDPKALNYNRDREIGRAYSLQLAHTVGCNTLFTTLIRHARRPGATGELTTWWSAPRCGRQWGDIVTPDAYAHWREAGLAVEWFTEYDTGTEQLSRLGTKIHRYARLAEHTGIATPILFWFPGPQREANARQELANTLQSLDRPGRVPVATTHPTAATHPVDVRAPRWLPVHDSRWGRLRLAELSRAWPTVSTTSREPLAHSAPSEVAAPRPTARPHSRRW